jgi:PAS domain S-box-containing protein
MLELLGSPFPALRPDVAAFIGQRLGIALLSVILVLVHVPFYRDSRVQFPVLWAFAWAMLAACHTGFAATAALAPEPGTLATPYFLLTYATVATGLMGIASLGVGVYSFLRRPWSPLALGAGAIGVLVVAALLSLGADESAESATRYSVQTGVAAIGSLGAGIMLRYGLSGNAAAPPRFLSAALMLYALPMAAHTVAIVLGAAAPAGGSLDLVIGIGHVEFAFTAVLGLSAVHRVLVGERAQAQQSARTEQLLRRELEEREMKFRAIVEEIPALTLVVDSTGRRSHELRPRRAALGYHDSLWSERALPELIEELVHPDDRARAFEAFSAIKGTRGASRRIELRVRHHDGRWLTHECSVKNCLDVPSLEGIVITALDVTEQRGLEQRLNEAERLESVGRLAGGIAHDFNNLLTIVLGNAAYLADELPPGSPNQELISEIQQAAERGGTLTQHLLAFSRRQTVAPRVFDLNTLVADLLPILRRLVSESVAVHWQPAPTECPVEADPNRIEQVLVNLATNARDAMPEGGDLRLATARTADNSVTLSVRDTGTGMTADVRRRAMEPFFTTKRPGEGSDSRRASASWSRQGEHCTSRAKRATARPPSWSCRWWPWRPEKPNARSTEIRWPERAPCCWWRTNPWCGQRQRESCAPEGLKWSRRKTVSTHWSALPILPTSRASSPTW